MLPIIMSLVFLHSNTAVAAERTVRTGVYHNRPKVFIGQDGRPSGFYIDILNEIASAENWKLEYVTCSWAQCLDMLGRGEIDVMVDVAWSEERDKRFDFNNETVLWNWSQLYTRKGYRLNDIFDLEGRKIVVVGGDIAYGELRSITKRFGVNCIFLEVESFEKALEYLEEKKAHAGLISRLFGLQREHEYNVERTFLLVSPFDLRFAVPQGRNPDILPAMDRHLIRMKKQKNSIYYQAMDRWIKSAERARLPAWLKYGASALLGLLLLLAAFTLALRLQVRRKTADLQKANLELKTYHEKLESLVEERTQELAAANKELESFSYSVSHDLKAPIRSIEGFSQILLEEHENSLDKEGREHLRRICSATSNMKDLIECLLRLSRITRKEMNITEVNLSALVREITSLMKRDHPDRNVEVSVENDIVIRGDAALLKAALENILSNAWKFTRDRNMAKIEFGTTVREGERYFFIRDNGAGFDIKYADRIFLPFERLHGTGEFEGTGIGLATVQRIIHRHGGQICAEGNPGEGATFYFTLGT